MSNTLKHPALQAMADAFSEARNKVEDRFKPGDRVRYYRHDLVIVQDEAPSAYSRWFDDGIIVGGMMEPKRERWAWIVQVSDEGFCMLFFNEDVEPQAEEA